MSDRLNGKPEFGFGGYADKPSVAPNTSHLCPCGCQQETPFGSVQTQPCTNSTEERVDKNLREAGHDPEAVILGRARLSEKKEEPTS